VSHLLDTQIVLFAAAGSPALSARARSLLNDPGTTPWFSAASLWEIAIKAALGRPDFQVDEAALLTGLLDAGYRPLPVKPEHCLVLGHLPGLHKDPFDRMLLAQAMVENLTLVTMDAVLARYPGPVLAV